MDMGLLKAGSRLAEIIPSARGAEATITRVGTIRAVHDTDGYWTADVDMSGGTLYGVQMTTCCLGAAPGDRCVVESYAHMALITGIIARPGQPKTIQWKVPYSDDKIQITRIGGMCVAGGTVKYTSGTEMNDNKVNETLPLGFRPSYDNATIALSGARATVVFFGKKDGSIYGRGNTGGGAYTNLTGCWPTADPYPS